MTVAVGLFATTLQAHAQAGAAAPATAALKAPPTADSLAAIDYNSDDRNPYNPALLERLEAILRSFRWTESPE